ncbi:hypothetical protein AB205_0134110 [Aquarana catesbeiana]|uniref:exodeoxyribonuclease III n=1 Tax=Aquarana catesbeiana TaxID=8400 RepID=A0A2G9SJR7_AQUCT|nr:hypothetical protein AB205_0134110 [Aquarana catesbeiana]
MADGPIAQLQIASHNVQGLNSPIKRRKVLDYYKHLKLDIIMLQETHFPSRYSPKFLHPHFPQFFLASANNKTKGVAILISKNHKFVKIFEHADPEGRFLLVKGMVGDHLYSLVSYYAPNRGQATFFDSLLHSLAQKLEGMIILGGDLNAAFDQGLDKSKPPRSQLTRPTKESLRIAKAIHTHGLSDIWRELNPNKRDYTHYSSPHNTYARIDHILTPSSLLPSIHKAQIRESALSDHSIVTITLKTGALGRSRGHWRLNESLLSDPIRVTELETALQEYFTLNKTENTSPEMLWVAHKAFIRGKLIQISTQIKREQRADILRLDAEYNKLKASHKKDPSKTPSSLIDKARLDLNLALTAKAEKVIRWNKHKFYTQAHKIGPLLATRLSPPIKTHALPKIRINPPRLIRPRY